MRYVQYQGEFDIDYLREILGVKRATRPKQKPTIIREDMEGMIRRSIFRNTPDPD
jgi:hypothetical protein